MRVISFFVLGALATHVGCASSDGANGQDVALSTTKQKIVSPVSDASASHPNAGRVRVGDEVCSGTLVSYQWVLTAGHCVAGKSGWSFSTVGGLAGNGDWGVTYDWAPGEEPAPGSEHHDVGLIHLSEPVYPTGWPAIAGNDWTGYNGDATGHSSDGTLTNDDTIYVAAATTMNPGSDIGYSEDYYAPRNTNPGDSGGAVFLDGTDLIIAVNSGGAQGAPGDRTYSTYARVDLVHDWLRSYF